MTAPAERLTRCRYADRHGNPCSGEAVDPVGESLLCMTHLALVVELLQRHGYRITAPRKAA